jgi:hypothetical protein
MKRMSREMQLMASVLVIVMLMAFGSFGQSVVNKLENVKKPSLGKIYFSKKDSSLNVWKGKWVEIVQEGFGSAQPPVTQPPVTQPSIFMPPVTEPIFGGKIKVPVGLIMWDNWVYDYWNDPNPKYDYLINHISRNRYTATVWGSKFNLVPFYGSYHAPEKVKIRTNVKWNQQLGRNTFDEIEKWVEVKYDKTAADTEREVKYYRDAGFDFLCFNYYNTDSYLSEARQHFVAMQDKLGMKMTIKVQNRRSDAEIDNITALMTRDYWFRINGKAVLYMNSGDFDDLPKYQMALRAKGGGEIYVVYYGFDGYPGDWEDYQKKRNDAISGYNTTIGGNSTAEEQLLKEISDREAWMGQFTATHVQLIPVLSLGLENLDLRTDLGSGGKQVGIIEIANIEQVNRKFELMRDFIKKYPDKVPAVIWNSANEINESGESFVAKKLRNGIIDTSRLDVARKWLE